MSQEHIYTPVQDNADEQSTFIASPRFTSGTQTSALSQSNSNISGHSELQLAGRVSYEAHPFCSSSPGLGPQFAVQTTEHPQRDNASYHDELLLASNCQDGLQNGGSLYYASTCLHDVSHRGNPVLSTHQLSDSGADIHGQRSHGSLALGRLPSVSSMVGRLQAETGPTLPGFKYPMVSGQAPNNSAYPGVLNSLSSGSAPSSADGLYAARMGSLSGATT